MITRRATNKQQMERFLSFVTCPDSYENPPTSLKEQLTRIVAAYLRADLNELERTRKDMDEVHGVNGGHDVTDATGAISTRNRKRTREGQTNAESAADMRASKRVRGDPKNPPLYRSPSERVADVPPMG